MKEIKWRKSTYSSSNGGNCVEVAATDRALVRDTKQHKQGPVLRFTPAAWRRFADQVKRSLPTPAKLVPVPEARPWETRQWRRAAASSRPLDFPYHAIYIASYANSFSSAPAAAAAVQVAG